MNNCLTNEENQARLKRARRVYAAAAVFGGLALVYLLWALRDLILPAVIGMVIAYICLPLIGYLRARGFSRFWAVITLFGCFWLALFTVVSLISGAIPDKKKELELQVRVRYKIDEKFDRLMGIDTGRKGNWLYKLTGRELQPLKDQLDRVLRLSESERLLFEEFYRHPEEAGGLEPVPEKYRQYYQANRRRDFETAKARQSGEEQHPGLAAPAGSGEETSLLVMIVDALSLWLITPLVFLVLLFDDGRLKKTFVRWVSNRYFEVSLTVLDNINEALGKYLRGTALECFLVGLFFTFLLLVVGLEIEWAATIGLIAGLSNAIPFLGPVIGLVVGLLYAVLAEEIAPLVPLVTIDNLPVAILAVVAVVQFLDNAVFQPYILGSAVDLHPLVVIFGVMGGAVLFGFAGMLFAIPAIVVIKVVVATMFREMRAYYII